MTGRRTALVAGSTGLIGKQLLALLLEDAHYMKVVALSRSPLPAHPKLFVIQTDLSGLTEHRQELVADDIFCCLGTTMRKAKSKEAFRKIDYEYPLALAQITKANGAQQFLLVSALGASKNSSIFYNRVKGEVEAAALAIGFNAVHIFRPSLLVGPREEQRPGEEAAKTFYNIFGFLIPARYKSIESIKVARAMIETAKQESAGNFTYESDHLQRY